MLMLLGAIAGIAAGMVAWLVFGFGFLAAIGFYFLGSLSGAALGVVLSLNRPDDDGMQSVIAAVSASQIA